MTGLPVRGRVVPLAILVALGASLLGAHSPFLAGARATAAGPGRGSQRGHRPTSMAALHQAYGQLPLRFEANHGQTDRRVYFLARGSGYTLFLAPSGAVLTLARPVTPPASATGSPTMSQPRGSGAVLWLKLAGANRHAQLVGLHPLHSMSNYFVGKSRRSWHARVPTYARVAYRHVYHGIDVVYYGNQGHLEYDFTLAPKANPRLIKLDIGGGWRVSIDKHGNAVVHTTAGNVVQAKPVMYQTVHGARRLVAGRYVLLGPHLVGFHVGRYDASKPLVIDPVLSYSTYLGGSAGDYGVGISVDSAGDAFITGRTLSTNFPGANALPAAKTSPSGGGSDAFVTELNAAGTGQDFVSYLGGDSINVGFGVAVDAGGNILITGGTESTLFPALNAAQSAFGGGLSDAFVTKLSPTGAAIIFSTYLGGKNWDFGGRVAVDAAENVYVTGATSSSNFPSANAAQPQYGGGVRDAFVTKLSPAGALLYSTYLGGSGWDEGHGIAADGNGNAYITGMTQSQNYPTLNALQPTIGGSFDGFVTKLNSVGALVYSSFLGGSADDSANAIAVDAAGAAYVTGSTSSANFPTAQAFQGANGGGTCPRPWFRSGPCSDAFIAKVSADGASLVYSTYLGGSGNDVAGGIAVDGAGAAYVAGSTSSTNFPTLNPMQATNGGALNSFDAFVSKVDAAGALAYSTYLGGSGFDSAFGIAVDNAGNAYVTGQTTSPNFPTANALEGGAGGGGDGFVSKISDSSVASPTATPTLAPSATATVSPTVTATLTPTASTATPTLAAGSGCQPAPNIQPQWKATLTAIARQTQTAIAGATQTAIAAQPTCTPVPQAATTSTATPTSTSTSVP